MKPECWAIKKKKHSASFLLFKPKWTFCICTNSIIFARDSIKRERDRERHTHTLSSAALGQNWSVSLSFKRGIITFPWLYCWLWPEHSSNKKRWALPQRLQPYSSPPLPQWTKREKSHSSLASTYTHSELSWGPGLFNPVHEHTHTHSLN